MTDKDCHKFTPSSFHYLNSVKYLFLFTSLKCTLHFVQLEFFSSSTCGHLRVFTFFVVMAVLCIIYCTTDFTSIFFMNLFLLSLHNLFAFPLFYVFFFFVYFFYQYCWQCTQPPGHRVNLKVRLYWETQILKALIMSSTNFCFSVSASAQPVLWYCMFYVAMPIEYVHMTAVYFYICKF